MPKKTKKVKLKDIFPKQTAKLLKKAIKKPKTKAKKSKKKIKVVKRNANNPIFQEGIALSEIQKENRDIIGQDRYTRSGASERKFNKIGKTMRTLEFYNQKRNLSETRILDFVNKKSFNMGKSDRYNDYKISVNIEYEDGSYTSSKFVDVGEDSRIIVGYGETIDPSRGGIVGFNIQFIQK